ncbi:hypothetical protein Tco_0464811 [Tanacetum coccineum]
MADLVKQKLAITTLNKYGITLEEAAQQLNMTLEEFLERLKELNIRNLPRMVDPAQQRLSITTPNNYGITLEEAARQLNMTLEEFLERLKELNIQNWNLPRFHQEPPRGNECMKFHSSLSQENTNFQGFLWARTVPNLVVQGYDSEALLCGVHHLIKEAG